MARTLDAIDREIREVKGRTFKHLGDLLIEIVDRKLYQDRGFTNVEDYFQSEPSLPSARQAFRLISATRFSRQLPPSVAQPKSERQVRPLLGRKREEARLLWTIATLVAEECHCALDGKLVATVAKQFDEGLLSEFIPEACDLLGDAAPHIDVTSAAGGRQAKKQRTGLRARRAESDEALYLRKKPILDARETAHLIWTTVRSLEAGLRGAALGAENSCSVAVTSERRKRPRRDASVSDVEAELNAVLENALSGLFDLATLLGQPIPGQTHALLLPVSSSHIPQIDAPAKNGSSEDEISVAEALITLSHVLPDHL